MVKINSDLISKSAQFLNPVKEFQLDLRGYKIPAIENLSATNDQFGCIDISDNSITILEALPRLNRLRTLLIINNRILKIEDNFGNACPNLENLILTNNKVANIREIDHIASCKSLVRLSLVDNLVTKLKYYRLYTIYKMPNLRVLDFQKIKAKERAYANALFKTEKGLQIIEDMYNSNYQREDEEEYIKAMDVIQQDIKKKQMLYNLIKSTESLEEFRRLEKTIISGNVEKDLFVANKTKEDDNIYGQDEEDDK